MDAKEGEGTEGDEGERGRVPRVILQFLIWVDSLEFGDQMHFFSRSTCRGPPTFPELNVHSFFREVVRCSLDRCSSKGQSWTP